MSHSCGVVIGSGALGRRHLESLVIHSTFDSLWVIDSSADALKRAADTCRSLCNYSATALPVVNFSRTAESLPHHVDLAIVATTAESRTAAVRSLRNSTAVRFMVLEKVLTRSRSDLEVLDQLRKGELGTWVNYPRRMMAVYRELKWVLDGSKVFSIRVVGNDWALISNSLHFVDLCRWLSGETPVEVTVTQQLRWVPSHRDGLLEAHGGFRWAFSGGTFLDLESRALSESSRTGTALTVAVETDRGKFTVSEEDGVIAAPSGERTAPQPLEYQSQLSGRLASQILVEGLCDLATYAEAAHAHRLFLNAVLPLQDNYLGECRGEVLTT